MRAEVVVSCFGGSAALDASRPSAWCDGPVLGEIFWWWDMMLPVGVAEPHVDAATPGEAAGLLAGWWPALKQAAPTLQELDMAARAHQWREVQRHMRRTLKAFVREVTEAEVEWLAILDLPPIEAVREAVAEEAKRAAGERVKQGPADGPFDRVGPLSAEKRRLLSRVFDEWAEDMAGPLGVYRTRAVEAYAIGIAHAHVNIQNEARRAGAIQFLTELPPSLVADAARPAVRRFLERGEALVRHEVSVRYAAEAADEILRGFTEGAGPLEVAKRLHRRVGEGQAWHWNRLARTETAAAVDMGAEDQLKAAKVPYERWRATLGRCPICAALDGKVWAQGEGPRVVWDTHPHCLCVRVPVIRLGRDDVVQGRFPRRAIPDVLD